MNVRGLSPKFQLEGMTLQFELRPRDALVWQQFDTIPDYFRTSFVAQCPEALIFLLFAIDDCSSENNSFEPNKLSLPNFDPIESETCLRVTIGKQQKLEFQQAICSFANANSGNEAYTRLIANCLTEIFAVDSSTHHLEIDSRLSRIPKYVWLEIATAIEANAESECVEGCQDLYIPLHSSGNSNADKEEFERRLHLEKMASMKQLAYGASHEINNPLANIASRAQTLLKDETDPGRRLKLAKINEQAFRANEMIADMMLFAHPPQPNRERIDPVEIVNLVISELTSDAAEQGTTIETSLTKVEPIDADRNQLAVAVKAIIKNSLESLREGGNIHTSVAKSNDSCLAITVVDDGPGFSPETAKHLFDPFYSGREAGRGLGFGLSKAWRIAELHGGEISAESPEHAGAKFCLRIPYQSVNKGAGD